MRRELKPVRCHYCGKEFTPVATNEVNDPLELFDLTADMMQSMLDDGLPLECGTCGPHGAEVA